MEQAGVSIDTAYLKELSDELKGNIDRIEAKISSVAGSQEGKIHGQTDRMVF